MVTQELALKVLVRQRHMTYESFCREWDRTASALDDRLKGRFPGHAQYYRWLRGDLVNGRPYPDACRMLEALFPGWSVERLFSPYVASGTTGESQLISPELPEPSGYADVANDQSSRLEQIEILRQEMNQAIGAGAVAEATLEDWERGAIRYARATRDRPPTVLVGSISNDLAELRLLISGHRSASALRRLIRVMAQLSGLMCLEFCKLDDRSAFQRWARTARLAANEAGDPETISWILAQEAYGIYYAGDLPEAIDVARSAYEAVRTPCVGRALAAALEARAHAAMGRDRETREALDRAEVVLGRLDEDSLTPSAFGYNESSFRFHEGNAYTHLRNVTSALKAQDRAMELCSRDDYTDWAMVRLDRADCIAYSGDITSGLEYATGVMSDLSADERNGIIIARGRKILRALPAKEQKLPVAVGFHELLMLPLGESQNGE